LEAQIWTLEGTLTNERAGKDQTIAKQQELKRELDGGKNSNMNALTKQQELEKLLANEKKRKRNVNVQARGIRKI
jgi:hypothetical protein